ncbi:MAG: hypothetical protein ACRENE_12540 [Polyangiaceae bacterium]
MIPRTGAAALVCSAALAGWLALPACSKHTKTTEQSGPFLSVFAADAGYRAQSVVTPDAVTLALGGLPPEEIPRLRKHLAESTDGALQRAAPELFDLDAPPDAGPAVDPMRDSLPDLPALTAAANVLGDPWEAPGISVHLGPTCEVGASRCVPLFGAASGGDDALLRRGRGLAWALAHAALVRGPPETRGRLLSLLRAAQLRPAGTIAMVFVSSRGSVDPNDLDALRREARRAIEPLRPEAPQRPWLEALAAARPEWELPITLDADQVLVVPRLRVLARIADFVSEVEGASRPRRPILGRLVSEGAP